MDADWKREAVSEHVRETEVQSSDYRLYNDDRRGKSRRASVQMGRPEHESRYDDRAPRGSRARNLVGCEPDNEFTDQYTSKEKVLPQPDDNERSGGRSDRGVTVTGSLNTPIDHELTIPPLPVARITAVETA